MLVTGASGFIGSNLVRHLVRRGHQVTAMVRSTSNLAALAGITDLRFAVADLESGDSLAAALDGVGTVIHLAGVPNARQTGDYWRGNVDATRRLCQAIAARAKAPRIVLCSSLAAAGPSRPGCPRDESDAVRPVSQYGRSKLAAEQVVRGYADRIQAVILRPPMVYGPGDRVVMPTFLPMARRGVCVKAGLGRREYSIIHVFDLCAALLAAIDQGTTLSRDDMRGGAYFVSDGHTYAIEDLCAALSRAVGRSRVRTIPVPRTVVRAGGLLAQLIAPASGSPSIVNPDKVREFCQSAWTCRTTRARDELAFTPRYDLADGLAQAMTWYRDQKA